MDGGSTFPKYLQKLLVLCVLVVCADMTFAQTVTGSTSGPDGIISQVSVIAYNNALERSVVGFSISNSEGNFYINLSGQDSILLHFSAMGFRERLIQLDSLELKEIFIDVFLQIDTIALKEIEVVESWSGIEVSGDTAKFNLDKFKDGSEVVLEDILKKLPGVEVMKNGMIKINGKPISALLLEGDDLFGSQYIIGSRNLDAKIIDSVEAIENYSSEPLLKGLENSGGVVLNVKLKEGELSFSSNLNLGVGFDERAKAVATAIGVTSKHKAFVVASFNNIGDRLDTRTEGNSTNLLNETSLIRKDVSDSPLDTRLGNLNQESFLSANSLAKVGTSTLKSSVRYLKDEQIRIERVATNFLIPGSDTITSFQSEEVLRKPEKLSAIINLIKSPSSTEKVELNSEIQSERIVFYQYGINLKDVFGSTLLHSDILNNNSLSFTKRKNPSTAVILSGKAGFRLSRQRLVLTPGFDFENEYYGIYKSTQTVGASKHDFGVRVDVIKRMGLSKVRIGAALDYFTQQLITNANGYSGLIFQNDISSQQRLFLLVGKFDRKFRRFSVSASVKASAIANAVKGVELNNMNRQAEIIPAWGFNLSRSISSNSFSYIHFERLGSLTQSEQLFPNYIITSYNSATRNRIAPTTLIVKSISAGYRKNDLYNLFQIDSRIAFIRSDYTSVSEHQLATQFSLTTQKMIDLPADNINVYFFASKFVASLLTTLSIRVTHLVTLYKNSINSSEFRSIRSDNSLMSMSFRTGFKRPIINFENSLSLNRMRFISLNEIGHDLLSLQNRTSAIANITRVTKAVVSVESYAPNTDNEMRIFHFISSEIRYEPIGKKIIISISGSNLMNHNLIGVSYVTDFSTSTKSSALIGRYIMGSIQLRF